jgi:hypothetical protein
MGPEFLDHTAKHLNAAALGRADDRALANRLLAAARGDAFTVLDFEEPGGPSPSFMQALIVDSVAIAVSYLRGRDALSDQELLEIDGWARELIDSSDTRAEAVDHEAAVVSALLLWGAATDDAETFARGRRGVERILGRLAYAPYFIDDLRNNNETMHHMIHAAWVLELNGVATFDVDFGGRTFSDAIAYHADQVLENGTREIGTVGDPLDDPRSIMRSQGFGTHLAWIPVYLSAEPDSAAADRVRALDAHLRSTDRKPYYGLQLSMHSGCLHGDEA